MEVDLAKTEKEILKFWQKEKIFEKSLERTKKKPRFIFYEGPPFANGLPGIHHLLARSFKDVVLRYKTMRGFYVERKAGWDTHGLPTEMAAEKALKIKSKKEIEKNIGKFIKECQNNVFTYKKEWEDFTERIGYWLDLKKAYITCSNDYIESLWWILKQIWEKGLLYQDYKVVPYCPRCGTSLSSHEVAQGYRKISEKSIIVKFTVNGEKNTYFLVWTTTPWTLPGNVAIAVNPDIDYVKVPVRYGSSPVMEEYLILAKNIYEDKNKNPLDRRNVHRYKKDQYDILIVDPNRKIETIMGKKLIGKDYEPLYSFTKLNKRAHFLVAGDFVSTKEGTGLVHIAPAFGEDDMEVGKKNNLPVILNVDESGKFKKEVVPWAGKLVKDKDADKDKDVDSLIIDDLGKKKPTAIFDIYYYEHEYPFCWRCDSPLLYYAKQSWFIKVTAVKKELIENNKKINWVPSYLKDGRFGEWLKEVKDWNLSRERYWGTPLPIWQCQKCNETIFIGSIKELGNIKDIHRPHIDKVVLDCKCGGKMKRVPEVIDCWFDSGSMPFAQWHYPFDNKNYIDKGEFFPADFISEGVDQTRGWFYTLLVISTLLGFKSPYKNVISVGIVLDAKGHKMSKSKGNIIKPEEIINKYGVDVARFYFYTINQVGEPKCFDFKDIQSLYRRFFDTLINTQNFFDTYTNKKFKPKKEFKSTNLLDKWIISSLETLNFQVVEKMEKYDVVGSARLFENFVDDLSNWYVRRSRKRFREESKDAFQTLHRVLLKLAKLLSPFCPFTAEYLYKNLNNKKGSVHLTDYPLSDGKLINNKLERKMEKVREIVTLALAERAKSGIKVRQPLNELQITSRDLQKEKELLELIKEEVNVKKITFGRILKVRKDVKITSKVLKVKLDTKITLELKEEGTVRELIRNIQRQRKDTGLKPKDKIMVEYSGPDKETFEKNKESILKQANIEKLILVDGEKKLITIKKI